MPLSKARDRERKQLAKVRLESNLKYSGGETVSLLSHKQDSAGSTPAPATIPNYDPRKHKVGDTVKFNGQVVTIPELDADGHPVWG